VIKSLIHEIKWKTKNTSQNPIENCKQMYNWYP